MWIGCGFVLALEQAAIERTNTASFPRIGGYYDLKRIVNRQVDWLGIEMSSE